MAEKKKWIQGVIKHPGALHKALDVPEGKKIPAKKLKKAARSRSALKRIKVIEDHRSALLRRREKASR